MKNTILFLLFLGVCLSVKHSLNIFFTATTGIPDVPPFMGSLQVDGIQAGSCSKNKKNSLQPKTDAGKTFLIDHPLVRVDFTQHCMEIMPSKADRLHSVMQLFEQSGGVHVLQSIEGCEWDENTGEVEGFLRTGYDGDNLVSLDLKKMMWIALTPQADIVKKTWDADEANRIERKKNYPTQIYHMWLKMYLSKENISTLQIVPPSVSLLQKSPSSPVSCHATGFYPNRAKMFWRKDGEEIHEDVDQGEILPNHDGTFQMRVDLNVSSVKDEDWSRYDCVVQISGVENRIISKLEKTVIRTNRVPTRVHYATAFVGLLSLAACVAGFVSLRVKNTQHVEGPATNPEQNQSGC